MELSQNLKISTDPGTKGFDLSAGKTWIYPENYPVRDYQFNIVKASLYCNTLVCLPTGLGKTFIGAVIMYNFWRWYPCGKIVFLAPTKPLVAQQIFACHNVMGIPATETIELTGAVSHKQREKSWCKQRVIFATPQVFHNDLEKNIVPADLVKCIVIDEAHKALGKHSYCECIKILNEKNKNYRVLALSATPGNKIDNVHEVLQNLCIAHVELRDDTSPDIIPYINQRKVDVILVPLNNQLNEYKEQYICIMDCHVRVLIQNNVLRGHTANISKGRIFHLLREFQKKTNRSGNYGQIMKTLNILMTMYHAYELMIRDGLRAFLKFYQNHSDKFWMNEEIRLQELLEYIEKYLGEFPDVKTLTPDSEIPPNIIFGHPKFEKLKELLVNHFKRNQNEEDNTRAIVFVEYRDIVSEVYVLLLQCRPFIRPQMFVGQAGQKQKQQIKALEDFRSNRVNVLISTSIGEEGLDVGEVDLIICFDISQHSPTRLVQRMGRTGRRRDGHIIILVTDGKEHETLKTTIARRDSLNNKILRTGNILSSLYQENPRMIPDSLSPECLKMHINVQPRSPTVKRKNETKKSNTKSTKSKKVSKKAAAIESNTELQGSKTKSLMDFFQNRKDEDVVDLDEDFKVPTAQPIRNNKVSKTIKPNDVKILSCDNAAIDFLTTCAVRNSQKDTIVMKTDDISDLYLPKFSPIKDFFQFSIPDPSILDCLVTLTEVVRRKQEEKIVSDAYDTGYINNPYNDDLNNDINEQVFIETIQEIEYNDCIAAESKFDTDYTNNPYSHNDDFNNDINEQMFIETIQENEYDCIAAESKFEDLLDDSSKSNESDGLDLEDEDKENKYNVNHVKSFANLPQKITNDEKVAINNTSFSHNLEPGSFEDILNDTSDSECTSESAQVAESALEASSKYYDARNRTIEDIETSIKNLKVENIEFGSFTASNNSENATENNVTAQTCIEKKNKSLLSVTQAISEIARINSNSDSRMTIAESDDDMFEDEFVADLADIPDFEADMKCSVEKSEPDRNCSGAQSEPEMKYSCKQNEPKMNCSIAQSEPVMKYSFKQNKPKMNCSVAQNEPEMKYSSKQNEPKMNYSVAQNEPKMNCSVAQNEPKMNCSVAQTEPEMKYSFKQNEPKMKYSSKQNEPKMNCSIAQREPEMKYSFKQNEPKTKYSFKQNEPKMNCSVAQNQPKMNCSVAQNKPKMNCSVAQTEPEMKYSFKQNEPKMKYSSKQNEPKMNCSVAQNEPKMNCSIAQRGPEMKYSFKQNEPKTKYSSKQNEPKMNCSVAQNEPKMNCSVAHSEPEIKYSFEQNEPKMNCSIKQTTPTAIKDSDFGNVSDRKKKTVDAVFTLDDYVWDDDFEVCDSEQNGGTASNWFKEEKNESKGGASSFTAWDSDDDWISVKKSAKKSTSGTSISRKLASVKQTLSLKRDSSKDLNGRATNRVDVKASNFFEDKNKNVEFDTSYFFEDLIENVEVEKVDRDSAKSRRLKALSSLCNKRKNKRRRVRNEFIDDEAQVSSNDEARTSDESSGTDQDLEDFVSYTQNVHDTSDMRAHYLQTIRSPVKRHDGFIFKEPRAVDPDIEIYSQPVSQTHDSYLNDSFCVAEYEESVRVEELSELEKAEQQLERRKRKRAKNAENEDNTKKRKKRNRRINIINHSSSSEDETAILREQIKEESFLLAQANSGNRF